MAILSYHPPTTHHPPTLTLLRCFSASLHPPLSSPYSPLLPLLPSPLSYTPLLPPTPALPPTTPPTRPCHNCNFNWLYFPLKYPGWNCVIGGNLAGWTNSMECFDADLPYTGRAQRTTIPLSVRRRFQSGPDRLDVVKMLLTPALRITAEGRNSTNK